MSAKAFGGVSRVSGTGLMRTPARAGSKSASTAARKDGTSTGLVRQASAPSLRSLGRLIGAGVGGENDHGDRFGTRVIAPGLAQNLLTAQVRQVQVEHDHARPVMARELDAEAPLPGRFDRDRRSALQDALDQADIRDVVLDGPATGRQAEPFELILAAALRRALDDVVRHGDLRRDEELRGERGSDPELTVHGERSPHRLHQLPGERQAQSRPLDVAELGPEPLEWSERVGQALGGDTQAGVPRPHAQARLGTFAADHDLAAFAVVLDRVGEEVQEHLLQSLSIRHDAAFAVHRLELHPKVALRGHRSNRRDHVAQQRRHGDGL